jgi:hypothetical protein
MKTASLFTFVVSLMVLGLLSDVEAMAKTYTTNFPLTENPISESGTWINGQAEGLLWANCRTTNNFVWGNDNRGVVYADPTALLTGTWGSNQTVTATVKVINQPTGNGCCSEIELRLRSTISANTNRGYEILFSTYTGNDYVQIVTWHGPRGVEGVGLDYVASTSGKGAPVNGDVVSASISNSTIRVYKNNVLILTGVNTEWSGGNPGVGFYGDTTPNVGFSRLTATDGMEPPPAPRLSALVTNGQVSVSFETVPSQSYTIQQKTNLAATNWVTLTNFMGKGSTYQFSTPTANTRPSQFFRVREP